MKGIEIQSSYENKTLKVTIKVSSEKLYGKGATLELKYGVQVQDSCPINSFVIIEDTSLTLTESNDIDFFLGEPETIYYGKGIDVVYFLSLKIQDTFLLFDSQEDFQIEKETFKNDFPIFFSPIQGEEDSLLEGAQKVLSIESNQLSGIKEKLLVSALKSTLGNINTGVFSLQKNSQEVDEIHYLNAFRMLPIYKKVLLAFLASTFLVGIGLLFFNTALGILCIIVGIIGGLVSWSRSTKSYIKIQFCAENLENGMFFSRIITGNSQIRIENTTLEIYLANNEKGAYIRGNGTSERTINFDLTVKKILLYSKTFGFLNPGEEIGQYLEGNLDLSKAFPPLFPQIPNKNIPLLRNLIKTHGLDTYLIVKVIHPDLPDYEVKKSISVTYKDYQKLVSGNTTYES